MTDIIRLRCVKCKSYGIEFPADPKPSDIVTCAKCSATVTYRDALSEAEDLVRKLANNVIRKKFNNFK